MRRLIFATQKLDPSDSVLAATVPMVRALAERVDELVVLCDSAAPGVVPDNVVVHEFGAPTQAQRGVRFLAALGGELRPRPLGVVAHMVPLYALLAAPLVRPCRIPLLLWYTHWKSHAVVRAAERVSTAVISVDRRSFPLDSPKVRGLGHGIDVSEFPCAAPTDAQAPLRALVLGRYSPAKGLDTIVRASALAGIHVEMHGTDVQFEEYKRSLARLAEDVGADVELGGPVERSEIPAIFARSDVLINNMRTGAADKVVYEAAAACLPVLASSPIFEDLLPEELRFDREDPSMLAARLGGLARVRRPDLRDVVIERHSVAHWADGVLATVERR